MSSTGLDRITGIDPSVAIKAPCKVATTANVTLSGAQTIDGVALTETTPKTRVLVKNQTDTTENGIYNVMDTAWTRASDFNGTRDAVDSTLVSVDSGDTYPNGATFRAVATNPIVFGTSTISFVATDDFTDNSVQNYATLALAAAAITSADVGKILSWTEHTSGYGYKGGNSGIVKVGTITDDNGSLIQGTTDTSVYIEALFLGGAYPEQFGATSSVNSTTAITNYEAYCYSNNLEYREPLSALSTKNIVDSRLRNRDRRRFGTEGIAVLRQLFAYPERGLHFVGDSVMNGYNSGGQSPGDARNSYSWPNIFGYGLRRFESPLLRHDSTLCTTIGSGSTNGSFTGAPLGSLVDYDGFLDASTLTGSGGAAAVFTDNTPAIIEFDLPRGGYAELLGVLIQNITTAVDVTVSVNGGSFFTPTEGDNFSIEGFPDPGVLDFTSIQLSHRIFRLHYDQSAFVKVRFESTTAQKLSFFTGVTRHSTATIFTPTTNTLSKNSADIYGPVSKLCALPRKGDFNTLTISYLADSGGAGVQVRFFTTAGTIVAPSTISGMSMHDTLGAGGLSDEDEMDTDSTSGGGSGIQKYITRSYFMDDKSDLSAAGVVGVILYNTTPTNFTVHDIAFHGIVNNEGVNGETTGTYTSGELTRVVPYLRLNDIVVVGTGINDWGLQEASNYLQQKSNYRSLALALTDAGAQVVFMTPTQVQYTLATSSTTNNRAIRFEDVVNAMVDAANELGIPVIDWNAYNQEFTDWNSTYMDDDLHPNRDGHILIANELLKQLGLQEYESS